MKTGSVFEISKTKSLSKKNLVIAVLSILLPICIFPALLCAGVFTYGFISDWIDTGTRYQRWLSQNKLRVDFSAFDTRDEVRKALLTILPVGTSEEELKAFYLANASQGWSESKWEPDNIGSFCWSYEEYWRFGCNHGVVLRVNEAERGHILRRTTAGEYIIVFELDPDTRSLKDIQVGYWNTSLNF